MPSKEYFEGRDMEKHLALHGILKTNFGFDQIDSDGRSQTKGDIIGVKNGKFVPVSVKNASGKNTQVHLPTLNSFAEQTNMPDKIKSKLDRFLGTNNSAIWNSWLVDNLTIDLYEKSHQRIKANKIPDWHEVEEWFNSARQKIAQRLLQTLKDDNDPVIYLVWINKKVRSYQIVDVNGLIEWITSKCSWTTTPGQTVIRCNTLIDNKLKPIFTMQMKGSKVKDKEGQYDHNPQFHLYPNWPKELVLYSGILPADD